MKMAGVITTKCNCGRTVEEKFKDKTIKSGWGYCPNCGYVKLADGVQYIPINLELEGGE
jgi:hypothetical protein